MKSDKHRASDIDADDVMAEDPGPVLHDMQIDGVSARERDDRAPVSNHVKRCICGEGGCACAPKDVTLHLSDEMLEELEDGRRIAVRF